MRNFFKSETLEGKVSEVVTMLSCDLRKLYREHRKMNVGSLSCFYKIGAFGDKNHIFSIIRGKRLIEAIENEDKVLILFNINEKGKASEVNITIQPVSQYEWSDFCDDYKRLRGNGICFSFIFNGDDEHSSNWLHLEKAQ